MRSTESHDRSADFPAAYREGARASFLAEAGRQIGKPADKLMARYLDAHGDGAELVEADEVERVLADVETDRGNRIG